MHKINIIKGNYKGMNVSVVSTTPKGDIIARVGGHLVIIPKLYVEVSRTHAERFDSRVNRK